MRTTIVLSVLFLLSAVTTSCQSTANVAGPVADSSKPSAQAPAATQASGPDQWKAILGFTLEFPQAAPPGGGSNPVPPAAFSLSESLGSRPDDLWSPLAQPIEIKFPLVVLPLREIKIPAEYFFIQKPAMDLIDDTRGPLPGR